MKYVISKKDKAGNLQYVRHVESAQRIPETLTSCEKSGVCTLPGWVRVVSDAYKFETSEAATACLDTLPKNTVYTVSEMEPMPILGFMEKTVMQESGRPYNTKFTNKKNVRNL